MSRRTRNIRASQKVEASKETTAKIETPVTQPEPEVPTTQPEQVATLAPTIDAVLPKVPKSRKLVDHPKFKVDQELNDLDTIVVKVTVNPKRSAPAIRFQYHMDNPNHTVKSYIDWVEARGKAGHKGETQKQAKDDLKWNVGHGYIEIMPVPKAEAVVAEASKAE